MLQMFYPSLMAVALFCMIACWGVHIIAVDPSNLDRLVRRDQPVVEATLDRVGEVEKTNLTCFNTSDPQSVNVNHIFNYLEKDGFLWRGSSSSILQCSDTSPPASSSCVPCVVNQTVYVICKNISETVELMMETEGGDSIDNIKADHRCPTIFEPSVSGHTTPPHQRVEETEFSPVEEFPWWGGLIIAIIIIIIIISVLVYKKRQSILLFARRACRCENPVDTEDRSMKLNGVSVDKPQALEVVDGTSAPLM